MHALAGSDPVQQAYHAGFQHAGADAPENIVPVDAIDDEVVDAGIGHQLTEQKP
ncbi:hypothetical protein D3C87_1826160 [compost metagenome]